MERIQNLKPVHADMMKAGPPYLILLTNIQRVWIYLLCAKSFWTTAIREHNSFSKDLLPKALTCVSPKTWQCMTALFFCRTFQTIFGDGHFVLLFVMHFLGEFYHLCCSIRTWLVDFLPSFLGYILCLSFMSSNVVVHIIIIILSAVFGEVVFLFFRILALKYCKTHLCGRSAMYLGIEWA